MRFINSAAFKAVILSVYVLAGVTPASAVRLTAHRGASYDAPENTVASFNLAWEQNADGIEGDFYLTSDGHIVCIHDSTTGRTGDLNLTVATSTLAELKTVDVGSWKGTEWIGERIPTLEEVLATIPAGKYIQLEIKIGVEIVEPMAQILEASSLTNDQIIIICFNQAVVTAAKLRLPGCRVLWLASVSDTSPTAAQVLTVLQTTGADGVGTSANATVIDADYVSTVQANGSYEFNVWTVNSGSLAEQFAATGLDAISTDRPEYIRAYLQDTPAGVPVVHWSFDGSATNSSSGGSYYDATLVNGPVYTNGTVGSAALALDGVNDYVSVPYTLPSRGSIAMWYYATPWYNYQSIYDNSVGENDWEMWIDVSGYLKARVKADNTGYVAYSLNELNGPDHWYHIVYTWDDILGESKLFVNGTLRDTGTISSSWVNNAGSTFYLGGGNSGNTACLGRYDDFRIYDSVLRQIEVQELFGQVMAVHLPLDGNTDDIAPGLDNPPATLFGNSSYVDGVDGQALELHEPGTQVCARVDYQLSLEKGSISLWYYNATQSAQYNAVFDNSADPNYWEMWTEASGILTVRVIGNSGRTSYNLNNLNGWNHWYHIVYTWDRTASVAKLYVNGMERSSDAIDLWVDPGTYFYLGGGSGGNTSRNGRWDDLRIYNRTITADEVQGLFSEYKNEVVYLPFDGDAVDQAGETNTVTLSGNPQYVAGIHGLALDGDGVGDNAAIECTLTEEGTIAFWYYAQGPWYNYQAVFDNSVNPDDWEMWIYNTGILRFRVDAGIGEVSYDLDDLDGPNHWYHIAVTWDRYGSARLYINGEVRSTDAIGAGWVDPGSMIYLGGHTGNTLGNGAWDEVHIYNRILEQSEITDLAVRPLRTGTIILVQ